MLAAARPTSCVNQGLTRVCCACGCAEDDLSLVAHLLRLKDPFSGDPLSDKHLLPEILTFVFAGFDTTGHTMAWALVSP